MPTYPFLSDEWIAEARKIRAEVPPPAGDGPAPAAAVRMNQVINEVPFGSGTLDAHLDTSSGTLEMETGHLEHPDVTVTLDYDTAKAIFVDGTLEAGMKAFMDGKVRVQGDMAKLIAALQQLAPPDPGAVDQAQRRIREITA
ncbi:MAG TPA: SCP2 sterol-binding domain-containing protein [Acidimicrobiales bacterium]|nr:SCP2 sterol-binding domain-containing protein [Acidimicrobiales bacterium]